MCNKKQNAQLGTTFSYFCLHRFSELNLKSVLFPRQTTESPSKKDSKIKSIQSTTFSDISHWVHFSFPCWVSFNAWYKVSDFYYCASVVHFFLTTILLRQSFCFHRRFVIRFFDEGDHTRSIVPHSVVQRDANMTPRDAVSRIAAADRRWFVNWGGGRRLLHRKCSPGVSSGVPKCAAFINYTVA